MPPDGDRVDDDGRADGDVPVPVLRTVFRSRGTRCARSRGTENRDTYWSAVTRSPGSSPAAGRMDRGPSPYPIGLPRRRRADTL